MRAAEQPWPLPLWPPGPYLRLLEACGVSDPASWEAAWRRRLQDQAIHSDLLWAVVLPLLSRCRRAAGDGRRLLIGLNGPVGAGKSSLAGWLCQLAPSLGLRLATASIDDLYWPWPERSRLLAGNPFGVDRVPPGSHDTALLARQLALWRQEGELNLPRFDKRLRGGRGDRHGWTHQQADVVLLEGWLIGCRSIGAARLATAIEELGGAAGLGLTDAEVSWLPHWDAELEAYEPLWRQLDGVWVLRPTAWKLPRRWRFQAEARQRRKGGAALGGVELDGLVRASLHSLPAPLYQDPLISGPNGDGNSEVEALAVLDGRRRCRWVGTGVEARAATVQLSSLSSASSIG